MSKKMHSSICRFIFSMILLVFVSFEVLPESSFAAITAKDRQALIKLYISTNGDSWTNNSGWKDGSLYKDGFARPGGAVQLEGPRRRSTGQSGKFLRPPHHQTSPTRELVLVQRH